MTDAFGVDGAMLSKECVVEGEKAAILDGDFTDERELVSWDDAPLKIPQPDCRDACDDSILGDGCTVPSPQLRRDDASECAWLGLEFSLSSLRWIEPHVAEESRLDTNEP
jgi:hypothetical protein